MILSTIALILFVLVYIFAYVLGEVMHYRRNGDVWEWTKKINKFIPKNWK